MLCRLHHKEQSDTTGTWRLFRSIFDNVLRADARCTGYTHSMASFTAFLTLVDGMQHLIYITAPSSSIRVPPHKCFVERSGTCRRSPPRYPYPRPPIHAPIVILTVSVRPLTLMSREEVGACVSPADRAKLNLQMAYGVTSLFYMFLKTQGVSPSNHPVKAELDRIK